MIKPEIPGFEFIELLGEGGMAVVWKARQLSLDRIVAIKLLSSRYSYDEADIKRFQLEAQAAARLKHSGIVQVYDANVYKGIYYFVMEYIGGYTAGDWLRRKGVLKEKDALLLAECVADALGYAWDRERLVHCDIKPDNIMIDSDGTVKVADLGLARTLKAMVLEENAEEVLGTPGYMSPEQARGMKDLDFRSDIYSLGATLFHLLTGQLLFQNYDEEDIMELQITSQEEDPCDLNNNLSIPAGWLIEAMLAKDREARHTSWAEVKYDIQRVKNGKMPVHILPQGAVSTIKRSARRTESSKIIVDVGAPRSSTVKAEKKKRSVVPFLVTLCLIFVFFLISGFLLFKAKQTASVKRVVEKEIEESKVTKVEETSTRFSVKDRGEELLQFAVEYEKAHPDDFNQILKLYEDVIYRAHGTRYAMEADIARRRVLERKNEAVKSIMAELDKEAQSLIEECKFEEAIKVYRDYKGKLSEETLSYRKNAIRDIKEQEAQYLKEQERVKKEKESEYLSNIEKIALYVIDNNIIEALNIVKRLKEDIKFANYSDELNKWWDILTGVSKIDLKILRSFEEQIGSVVTVELLNGSIKVTIDYIKDGLVYASSSLSSGKVTITFGVNDLSIREKLFRLGEKDTADISLYKAIVLYKMGMYHQAERYISFLEDPVKSFLLNQIKKIESSKIEQEAENALIRMLNAVGIMVTSFDKENILINVEKLILTPALGTSLRTLIEQYRIKYSNTEFINQAEVILKALEKKIMNYESTFLPSKQPIVPHGFKEIAGNVDAVIEWLINNNSSVSRDQIRTISRNNVIKSIRIHTSTLEKIDAVGALTNLESLICVCYRKSSPLSDISCLKGLQLVELELVNCNVSDISALRGMPLKRLRLENLPVRDISILRDIPTIEWLDISGTRVVDFSVLNKLPLKVLILNNTQFRESYLLRNLPLERLEIESTRVSDFAPLMNLIGLNSLSLANTQIKNIEVLKYLPLKELSLRRTNVTDISPLTGKLLERLDISNTQISNLQVLRGMPLKSLDISWTDVKDLDFVTGMMLEYLNIAGTKVNSLAPLRGMKLTVLNIEKTAVTDLSPLSGMPLQEFNCKGVSIKDLSPLKNAPIIRLWIDNPQQYISFIRSLPRLRWLNGQELIGMVDF